MSFYHGNVSNVSKVCSILKIIETTVRLIVDESAVWRI